MAGMKTTPSCIPHTVWRNNMSTGKPSEETKMYDHLGNECVQAALFHLLEGFSQIGEVSLENKHCLGGGSAGPWKFRFFLWQDTNGKYRFFDGEGHSAKSAVAEGTTKYKQYLDGVAK